MNPWEKEMIKIKKIRALIEEELFEKIEEEMKRFGVSKYELGNKLILYFSDKNLKGVVIKTRKGKVLQFNTSKEVDEDTYLEILKKQKIQVEADYIRKIVMKYFESSLEEREHILFKRTLGVLNKAIEIRKKVIVKINKKVEVISPYFLKKSIKDGTTYIFSYCDSTQNFQFYKISDLKQVEILNQDIELKEILYIEKMKKEEGVI